MKYLLLIALTYFVLKYLGKMLTSLKIVDPNAPEVKKESGDAHARLHVDEADIEDADFKELED